MDEWTMDDLKQLLAAMARTMEENRDLLTALDAEAGDGDLGITMTKAFAGASTAAANYNEGDAGKMLMVAGMAANRAAASTMGTLIASGFMRAGKELAGKPALTVPDSATLLRAFVEGVMDRGKSRPGNKTIIDSLYPAARELADFGPQASFRQAWARALEAAKAGMEATRQMKAQHGRAAYYGDASIGKQDPGATVGMLMVKTIAENGQKR